METNQATATPLGADGLPKMEGPGFVSCRKCGDDLTYHPSMEPIKTESGRNRVMCVPCIYHML
jgi:hypothetical protein